MTDQESTGAETMITLLAAMLRVYKRLAELGRRKRDLLKVGQWQQLQQLVTEEASLAAKLVCYENERLQIQRQLSGTVANFVQLVQILDEPLRQQASWLRDELQATVAEITRLNQTNHWVMAQLLNYFRNNLAAHRQVASSASYDSGGGEGQAVTSRSWVDKIV